MPFATTARLCIRPLEPSDCTALCAIMGDRRVMYAWEHAFTPDEVQAWIWRMTHIDDPCAVPGCSLGYQALCLQKTDAQGNSVPGRLIGQAGLLPKKIHGRDCLELAYILGHAAWHKGYATEAGAFFLTQAFLERRADAVFCLIRPENTASAAVARRLGMQVCGEHMVHYQGRDMPHTIFSLTRAQ